MTVLRLSRLTAEPALSVSSVLLTVRSYSTTQMPPNELRSVRMIGGQSITPSSLTRCSTLVAGRASRLAAMVSQFTSPEHIDSGDSTALSKRIDDEIPEYKHAKASAGPITAGKIGVPALRSKCARFAEWLAKLENLKTNLKKPAAQANRTI